MAERQLSSYSDNQYSIAISVDDGADERAHPQKQQAEHERCVQHDPEHVAGVREDELLPLEERLHRLREEAEGLRAMLDDVATQVAVAYQHVREDLGSIPSFADWARLITPQAWMLRGHPLDGAEAMPGNRIDPGSEAMSGTLPINGPAAGSVIIDL